MHCDSTASKRLSSASIASRRVGGEAGKRRKRRQRLLTRARSRGPPRRLKDPSAPPRPVGPSPSPVVPSPRHRGPRRPAPPHPPRTRPRARGSARLPAWSAGTLASSRARTSQSRRSPGNGSSNRLGQTDETSSRRRPTPGAARTCSARRRRSARTRPGFRRLRLDLRGGLAFSLADRGTGRARPEPAFHLPVRLRARVPQAGARGSRDASPSEASRDPSGRAPRFSRSPSSAFFRVFALVSPADGGASRVSVSVSARLCAFARRRFASAAAARAPPPAAAATRAKTRRAGTSRSSTCSPRARRAGARAARARRGEKARFRAPVVRSRRRLALRRRLRPPRAVTPRGGCPRAPRAAGRWQAPRTRAPAPGWRLAPPGAARPSARAASCAPPPPPRRARRRAMRTEPR